MLNCCCAKFCLFLTPPPPPGSCCFFSGLCASVIRKCSPTPAATAHCEPSGVLLVVLLFLLSTFASVLWHVNKQTTKTNARLWEKTAHRKSHPRKQMRCVNSGINVPPTRPWHAANPPPTDSRLQLLQHAAYHWPACLCSRFGWRVALQTHCIHTYPRIHIRVHVLGDCLWIRGRGGGGALWDFGRLTHPPHRKIFRRGKMKLIKRGGKWRPI